MGRLAAAKDDTPSDNATRTRRNRVTVCAPSAYPITAQDRSYACSALFSAGAPLLRAKAASRNFLPSSISITGIPLRMG